jgi:hypothetical protein
MARGSLTEARPRMLNALTPRVTRAIDLRAAAKVTTLRAKERAKP